MYNFFHIISAYKINHRTERPVSKLPSMTHMTCWEPEKVSGDSLLNRRVAYQLIFIEQKDFIKFDLYVDVRVQP